NVERLVTNMENLPMPNFEEESRHYSFAMPRTDRLNDIETIKDDEIVKALRMVFSTSPINFNLNTTIMLIDLAISKLSIPSKQTENANKSSPKPKKKVELEAAAYDKYFCIVRPFGFERYIFAKAILESFRGLL